MKIGIITLPPYANYGGILQAYALCHVLRDMGHEPEVIYTEKRWRIPSWRTPLLTAKCIVGKFVLRKSYEWIKVMKKVRSEWPIVNQYTFEFVKKHVPYRVYKSYKSIRRGDYDAFVVGSDQVWRPKYFRISSDNANIAEAYLRFAKGWDVKRIAYAASFGVDNWEYTPEETSVCACLAKAFDIISVREESAIELCRKHLGVEATHVIDPTLLLEKEDYEPLINDDSTPHKGEILNYILDWNDEKRKFVSRIESLTNKQSFRVNSHYDDWEAPMVERIQPSVESWLQGYRDADIIVTDSFHACVFSIIFNKPFYVVGNKDRGLARIQSLLAMFDLEDRLVTTDDAITPSTQINWEKVNARRQELKTPAMELLNSHL